MPCARSFVGQAMTPIAKDWLELPPALCAPTKSGLRDISRTHESTSREPLKRWVGTMRSCCCEISDLNPTASTTWRRSSDEFTLAIFPGSSSWNFKTRTTRRCLREASSSSRNNDGGNSELSEQCLKPAWSWRGGRGGARMHDDKRRSQAGRHNDHKLLVGNIQDTTGNSSGVSFCHQFERWLLIPSSQGAPPLTRG